MLNISILDGNCTWIVQFSIVCNQRNSERERCWIRKSSRECSQQFNSTRFVAFCVHYSSHYNIFVQFWIPNQLKSVYIICTREMSHQLWLVIILFWGVGIYWISAYILHTANVIAISCCRVRRGLQDLVKQLNFPVLYDIYIYIYITLLDDCLRKLF